MYRSSATTTFVSCILAGYVLLKTMFQDFGVQLFYTSACGVLLFGPMTLVAIERLKDATDVCQDTRNTISKYDNHVAFPCCRIVLCIRLNLLVCCVPVFCFQVAFAAGMRS